MSGVLVTGAAAEALAASAIRETRNLDDLAVEILEREAGR